VASCLCGKKKIFQKMLILLFTFISIYQILPLFKSKKLILLFNLGKWGNLKHVFKRRGEKNTAAILGTVWQTVRNSSDA
jgi:hypothetical protein